MLKLSSFFGAIALATLLALPAMAQTAPVDDKRVDSRMEISDETKERLGADISLIPELANDDGVRLLPNGGRVVIKSSYCNKGNNPITLENGITVPSCHLLKLLPANKQKTSADLALEEIAGTGCITIVNNSTNLRDDYFIPWKTPEELGDFIMSANVDTTGKARHPNMPDLYVTNGCCPPQTADPICEQACPPNVKDCQLGYRNGVYRTDAYRALRSNPSLGDVNGFNLFGAVGDNTIIDAAQLQQNANITRRAIYTCMPDGTWNKSREEGSCTKVDGACNPALDTPNGITSLPSDLAQLCSNGSTLNSSVTQPTTNDPYWRWTCLGTPDADTPLTTCQAKKGDGTTGPVPPTCYSYASNGGAVFLPSIPTGSQLCKTGVLTSQIFDKNNNEGWYWECGSDPEGVYPSVWCDAYDLNKKIPGECGYEAGRTRHMIEPTWDPGDGSSSCYSPEEYKDFRYEAASGTFYWTCPGMQGGQDTLCWAKGRQHAGECGVSPSYMVATNTLPENACDPASTVMNVNYTPTQVTWQCQGDPGTAPTTCSAGASSNFVRGVCGVTTNTALSSVPQPPTYCSVGSVLNLAQSNGYYTWQCQGTGSGSTVNCSAYSDNPPVPQCGTGAGGHEGWGNFHSAAVRKTAPWTAEELCEAGVPSAVTADKAYSYDRWAWTCSDRVGGLLSVLCESPYQWWSDGDVTPDNSSVVAGVCGSSANQVLSSVPVTNLCSVGQATTVREGNDGGWNWFCQGAGGGADAYCSTVTTNITAPAQCGPTSGTSIPATPNTGLCVNGNAPGPVNGTGPWNWTCQGTNGIQQCAAALCQTCAGEIDDPVTYYETFSNQPYVDGNQSCIVNGSVMWTQKVQLGISNTGYHLALQNPSITFSKNVTAGPAPSRYCTPCSKRVVTNVGGTFTISRAGTNNSNCNVSGLNQGNSISVPITGTSIGATQ